MRAPQTRALARHAVRQYIVNNMSPQSERDIKKGSAELLVLALLDGRQRHGYEISKLIETRSGGCVRFSRRIALPAALSPLKIAAGSPAAGWKRPASAAAATIAATIASPPPAAGFSPSAAPDGDAFVEAIRRITGVEYA